VSTGGPDLFVICKSCGSEVSPYITECPYCGNRLRKRAPKLDREGRVAERKRRRRPPSVLPRLRRDEIPGIRPDSRPYGTIVLVAAGAVGALIWKTSAVSLDQVVVIGQPDAHHWWRLLSAPFIYGTPGYAFIVLVPVMLFGWLLERRHGVLPVVALFLVGGVGGTTAAAAAAPDATTVVMGANGAALALICAWALPDVLALRDGEDVEGDMLGALAIAIVVALTPLAVAQASWISDGVGIVGGLALGLPLARIQPR
jgi:membrane associated rhomboid family serine protease